MCRTSAGAVNTVDVTGDEIGSIDGLAATNSWWSASISREHTSARSSTGR